MIKILNPIQKSILLFSGLLLASLFIGCQQDPVEIDAVNLTTDTNALVQNIAIKGTLPSGALYEIELPPSWLSPASEGQRVILVYAHGYVDPGRLIALPTDEISDGVGGTIAIKKFITNAFLGYASTSYRDNGLVVVDAVKDITELRTAIDVFFEENSELSPPDKVLLVGPSEGGLVTVLTIEQNPGMFDAAIATCCPIGSFYDQLQYYGDAHVLFKYFFGPTINGINLGSPKRVSKHTMNAWNDGSLQAAIAETLQDDYLNNGGNKIRQFLNCANIPADRSNPVAVGSAILEVLRFPIMATNDAIARLGGSPYNNKNDKTIYVGSDNDRKLNLTVERIKRSDWEQAAQNVADFYETTGFITTPLVTLHNEFDHVSLYENQILYKNKVDLNPFPIPSLLNQLPVDQKYGHCNFTISDILAALNLLQPPGS
ncbi:MAG: hypothetical protein WBM53_04505 [Maribacter sp.]